MKFRKSRPSIAASIGRMIVVSIPKSPDASPEQKTDAGLPLLGRHTSSSIARSPTLSGAPSLGHHPVDSLPPSR